VFVPEPLYDAKSPFDFSVDFQGIRTGSGLRLSASVGEGEKNKIEKFSEGVSKFQVLIRKNSFPADEYRPVRVMKIEGDKLSTSSTPAEMQKNTIIVNGELKSNTLEFDLDHGNVKLEKNPKHFSYQSDKKIQLNIPLTDQSVSLIQKGYRVVAKAVFRDKNTGQSVESFMELDTNNAKSSSKSLQVDVPLPLTYGSNYYAQEMRYLLLSPTISKEEHKKLSDQGVFMALPSSEPVSVKLYNHNIQIDLNSLLEIEPEKKMPITPLN
jgi:hypothetical protein